MELLKAAGKRNMFFVHLASVCLFGYLRSVALHCIVCAGRSVLYALVALDCMRSDSLYCMRIIALDCMQWSHLVLPFLFNQCMSASLMSTYQPFCSMQPQIRNIFLFIQTTMDVVELLNNLDINDLEHIREEGNVPNQPADDKGMFNMFLYITFPFSEPLLSFSVLANVPAPVVEILPEEQNDQLAQQPQQLLPFEDISDEGQSIIVLFSVMSSHNITHFCFCRTRQRSSPGCGKPSRRAE